MLMYFLASRSFEMLMYVSMRRHVDCPKFQKRTAARRRTSDIMGREKQTNIYIYIYLYIIHMCIMLSVMISFDFEAAPGSVSERFGEITTKWR